MKKVKAIITKLLICFALISIGFAIGKNSVKKGSDSSVALGEDGNNNHIAVFYMHSTFRCASCNSIEKMAKALLDKDYAEELKDGRIKWKDVDFQDNEALADQFKVIASCVVVAQVKDGKFTSFKRLDEVWTLMKDPPAFDKYIRTAIDSYLKGPGGDK
jgi:hypothetical protein